MIFLLDTNILSELARPKPDADVTRWMSGNTSVAISVVTVEELSFGLTAKPNARLELFFGRFIERFCRVLDVTRPIAQHAGILRGQLRRTGKVRAQSDMLIAATAAAHGLTLATRNARNFEGCGVLVENPFNG